MENAKESYVLVDSSKIGQYSFANVARVNAATIITNHSDTPLLEDLKEVTEVIKV